MAVHGSQSNLSHNDNWKHWRGVLALLLALVLIGLLIWGLIGGGQVQPAFNCGADASVSVATQPVGEPVAAAPLVPLTAPELSGYFVDNQVIVTGRADTIDAVVISATLTLSQQIPGFTLSQPIQDCDLSFGGQARASDDVLPFRSDSLNALKMQLYQFTPTITTVGISESLVLTVVEQINAAGQGREVFADPNYLTIGSMQQPTQSGSGPCGSPNGVGGSPNGVGGSPLGLPGSLKAEEVQKLFRDQWAFKHIGLDAMSSGSIVSAALVYGGEGVRVAVFDTSPFINDLPDIDATAARTKIITTTRAITWIDPQLMLEIVLSMPPGISFESTSPGLNRTATVTSNHGLFVAGLIHALAPKSQIRLVPVLRESGCGDLATLVLAVNQFVDEMAHIDHGQYHGAVINASLGIVHPDNTIAPNGSPVCDPSLNGVYDYICKHPIVALQTAMYFAYRNDVVVVAAAGNNSSKTEWPLQPNAPARYPFVLGVSGSNMLRQRSCFSNWGGVVAPGGDAISPTITATLPALTASDSSAANADGARQSCTARLTNCNGNCAAITLIGLMVPESTDFPKGYAYWNGTSFSTPLVSGLAALVLEKSAQQSHLWMRAEQVIQAIRCGAATSDGVISIGATLFQCMSP